MAEGIQFAAEAKKSLEALLPLQPHHRPIHAQRAQLGVRHRDRLHQVLGRLAALEGVVKITLLLPRLEQRQQVTVEAEVGGLGLADLPGPRRPDALEGAAEQPNTEITMSVEDWEALLAGKLNAMILGLAESRHELVAFVDSDIRQDAEDLTILTATSLPWRGTWPTRGSSRFRWGRRLAS